MDKSILLLNMFPDYQPQEDLGQLLLGAQIQSADIDPESRSVWVQIFSPNYISQRMLKQTALEIGQIYGLSSLQITATFPADQLTCAGPEELMALFVEENSMTMGSLSGARSSLSAVFCMLCLERTRVVEIRI